MSSSLLRACGALTLSLAFGAAAAQTLELAGSTTVHKSVIEPTQTSLREGTGLDLKMLPVGSGKGMAMLFEGKVKVAAVSEGLDDAVASAKKVGATTVPPGLKLHTLANDELVPIVHPDNPAKELTREQLRGLLTGQLKSWKDVGGADLPVQVVTGSPGSATRAVVEKQLLGGQAHSAQARELRSTAAELGEVAREKAIAVANALLADDPLKDEGRAIRIGIAQAKAWAEHHGLPVHDTDGTG